MRGKRDKRGEGEKEGGEDGEGAECEACRALLEQLEVLASSPRPRSFFLPACARPAFPVSLVSSLLVDNGAFLES